MDKKEDIENMIRTAANDIKKEGIDTSQLSEKDLIESAMLFQEIFNIFQKHNTDIRMAYSVCAAAADSFYVYMTDETNKNFNDLIK